jgi:hypothetical protein
MYTVLTKSNILLQIGSLADKFMYKIDEIQK